MKKFLLKVSIFVVYAFMLQVVFPYVVDPFNVFHAEKIRANGVEPNKNYIKMKYILNNPEKFNGFLFGSSRVGAIHVEKISNEKIYNMTYSMGLPSEHLDNIKTFIAGKMYISKIYIGIDSISCTQSAEEHILQPLRCPYEYLRDNPKHFYSLYLNVIDTLRSILLTTKTTTDVENFYKYGWSREYGSKSNFDWEKDKIGPSVRKVFSDTVLHSALNDIHEIVELCKENDIELVVFTNPMHYITYIASIDGNYGNYFEFLEGIAKITKFYNFSSLNDVTLESNNYLETSHYKAEVGDMIINVICNGQKYEKLYEQGFGVEVTDKNVNDFINMLKKQAEDFRKSN